ncbi:DUF7426 family protein [Gordonia sp. MMO-8]|uniref:DUF7426 family protein n=1 Tax=Gordonia sp. MMO-8 TaxID=3127886 RepID=UPI0030168B4F
MTFQDLREFHDPDLLLPIGGKEYRIPQPDAARGLEIRQLFASDVLNEATELEHIMDILGAVWVPDVQQVHVLNPITGLPELDDDGEPIVDEKDFGKWDGGVWSEMVEAGITWEEIMHAGRTAMIDVGMGRVVAETHWVNGMVPSLGLPDIEGQLPENDPGNPLPAEPKLNREARRAAEKKKSKKQRQAEKEAAQTMKLLTPPDED